MGTSQSPNKPQSIAALTGVRGVAALWVVLFHLGQGVPGFSLVPWLLHIPILANGFRGVDLFFILSGYIMMHVHAADFAVIRGAMVAKFAVMRCLRIYPANLAALMLILMAVVLVPGYADWTRSWNSPAFTAIGFLQTATLSTRWLIHEHSVWNGITWSLSVELAAYLTLPLLAATLSRVQSSRVCLAIAFTSIAIMLVVLLTLDNADAGATNRLGLVRGVCGFVSGAAMCRFVAVSQVTDTQVRIAALFALGLLVVVTLRAETAMLAPFAFAILIASLAYQTSPVSRFMSSKPVMFLGKISFSLYLVHLTPALLLAWLMQVGVLPGNALVRLASLAAYASGVILLAAGLHKWVEKPSQRFGHRLAAGWSLPINDTEMPRVSRHESFGRSS